MRVFAGPRDDAFYLDSAATFDTLNFRAPAPVLSGSPIRGRVPPPPPRWRWLRRLHISLMRVEVPITMVTASGTVPDQRHRPQRQNRRLGQHLPPGGDRAPQPQLIPSTTATTCKWTASATR